MRAHAPAVTRQKSPRRVLANVRMDWLLSLAARGGPITIEGQMVISRQRCWLPASSHARLSALILLRE